MSTSAVWSSRLIKSVLQRHMWTYDAHRCCHSRAGGNPSSPSSSCWRKPVSSVRAQGTPSFDSAQDDVGGNAQGDVLAGSQGSCPTRNEWHSARSAKNRLACHCAWCTSSCATWIQGQFSRAGLSGDLPLAAGSKTDPPTGLPLSAGLKTNLPYKTPSSRVFSIACWLQVIRFEPPDPS
jgi:hypothetical protein